ncbi:MAG: YlbL family protein [Sciscionella sp.]
MSERTETGVPPRVESGAVPPSRPERGLARRTWTLLFSFALVIVLGLLGSFVRVPYVALGPGPTYNTLDKVSGTEVVSVTGKRTYPTGGELRMTTVSLTDDVTLFGALGLWLSGREALAPREVYFQPGQTREQIDRQNVREFKNSQSNADVAALRYLGYPITVVANQVVSGSPAAGSIKPGDELLEVNGKRIRHNEDVVDALKNTKPGQTVTVRLRRGDGQPATERIKLGSHPDRRQGFLGITPIDHADVNFTVKISLADVGGPSAGLAFALAVVDKLTPGELNGGKPVAGTGEIDDEGNVGEIGGINFKLTAAHEAGAQEFLVPAGNCAEAKASAPDGLRLIKVSTLSGAVSALRDASQGKKVPGC